MKELTLILILTVCLASACKVETSAESTSRTERASADPKASVVDASRKLIALNALAGKIEGAGKTVIKQDVEYIAPDKYHVSYLDESGAHMEMFIIGGDTYIQSDGTWEKISGDARLTPSLRDSFTDDVLNTLTEAKFEGEDTVDGKPAFVYSYKLVTMVGNFPAKTKMWISQSSGLPIKTVVDYPEEKLARTMTTYYDSERPIKIEPPIN